MIGFSIAPAFALSAPSECALVIPGGIDPDTFSCTFIAPDRIIIFEDWIGEDDAYIRIDGLDQGGTINYKVEKTITNSIPFGGTPPGPFPKMTTFSHEIHDKDNGTPSNDDLDEECGAPGSGVPNVVDDVCPTVDGIDYTRSNDPDRLSFSQGTPVPDVLRTSVEFSGQTPDEFGTRDFIDFNTGEICNTAVEDNDFCTGPDTDLQTFGLRDVNRIGENQPFLLRETLTPISPPMIGGQMVSSDFSFLAIAGMNDNAFNILGILSLVGVATFTALYFTVKRK